MSRTRRSGAHAVGSVLITLTVLLAACAAPRSPGSGTALLPSTSEPSPLPTGPVTHPPEAGASDGSATGEPTDDVVLAPGYRPFEHRYTGDFGTFDRTADDDMPGSIGDPPVPDGFGPLTISAEIDRFPVPCVRWHRIIVGVDAGDGPAADRIEARITDLAAALHAPFREQFRTAEDCEGIVGAAAIGESYQELTEVACVLPGGPALRCFELADFGMLPGIANGFLWHHQLVFEAATGRELSLRDLFAAVDVEEIDGIALVKSIVAELNNGWDATVRQAVPTADGLTFGFSPYEGGWGALGSLDLFVPWSRIVEARAAR